MDRNKKCGNKRCDWKPYEMLSRDLIERCVQTSRLIRAKVLQNGAVKCETRVVRGAKYMARIVSHYKPFKLATSRRHKS